jgi:hypothetical protein
MIVAGHGQIAKLELPPGWVEKNVTPPMGSSGARGEREFNPPGRDDVKLCLFYRGSPIPGSSAEDFQQIISLTPHVLSDDEIEQLTDVLDNLANAEAFDLRYARTIDFRGRKVLVAEGVWKVLQHEGLHFFVDADGSGKIIQEVYFTAPKTDFDNYVDTVRAALGSVEWI